MRNSCAGQSKYAWACFIISSFILTSLVDSQPNLTQPPESDVTSSLQKQEQTTKAAESQGQTTSTHLDNTTSFRGTEDAITSSVITNINNSIDDSNIINKNNNSVEENNVFACLNDECGEENKTDDMLGTTENNSENNINITKYQDEEEDAHNSTTDVFDVSTPVIDLTNQTTSATTALKEFYRVLHLWSTLLIQPVLGSLGLTGNIITAIVAKRSSLERTSNVLILALAVCDGCGLIQCINVVHMIRLATNYEMCQYTRNAYPPTVGGLCVSVNTLINFMFMIGNFSSGYMCALITIERVLAVYYPLHFQEMLSPRRAFFIVVGIFVSTTLFVSVACALWERWGEYYMYNWELSMSIAVSLEDPLGALYQTYILTPMVKIIPMAVIIIGSILIGQRVRQVRREQAVMTRMPKHSKSGMRTTKTLMTVCGIFCITKSLSFLFFLADFIDQETIMFSRVFMVMLLIFETINSSCNFLIYIFFNKKFKAELYILFSCCSRSGRSSPQSISQKTPRSTITSKK